METITRYFTAKVILQTLECKQDGGQYHPTGNHIKSPTGIMHEHKCTVCKMVKLTSSVYPIKGFVPDVEVFYEDLKNGVFAGKQINKNKEVPIKRKSNRRKQK